MTFDADAEKSWAHDRRQRIRDLQAKGYLRCSVYLGNLARMHDLPVEQGPGLDGPPGTKECDWVPAWLEWHMARFQSGHLRHVTQRARLEQAQTLLQNEKQQLLLLYEVELMGYTIYDPEADLSTRNAIELLKKTEV